MLKSFVSLTAAGALLAQVAPIAAAQPSWNLLSQNSPAQESPPPTAPSPGAPARAASPPVAPAARADGSEAPSLETLLQKIGGKPSQQTRFVERKYLALLDAPVESAGVLRYQAPARLEKNTERPIQESMMIDGDLLVMQREGRRRTVPAAQFPAVASLVGGLRDILGGDAKALRKMFKVVIQGDASRWQMDLLPSDPTSAELVNRITLRGRGDQLLEVETFQADGDRSVMTLSPG